MRHAEALSFTFNKSAGYINQDLTHDADFSGRTVRVDYTLRYAEPNSSDDNTTN